MRVWTTTEVIEKVRTDMDLKEETFVEYPAEYYGYINEAIDEAEAEIHRLYQGRTQHYFRKPYALALVNGTARYSLPSDIYASKITYIQYNNNNKRYKIEKINTKDITDVNDADYYMYDLENVDATTGVELVLYPTPSETVSDAITIWYIRNANYVTALTDNVDIPEFVHFIIAFVKNRIAAKEINPLMQKYEVDLEKQRALMLRTLDNMLPDEHDTIEPDLSFYEDFDTDPIYWGG
jgi:hypothetical protein